MDVVRLRYEAQQCHLRAVRSNDAAEVVRLHALGNRLSALADYVKEHPEQAITLPQQFGKRSFNGVTAAET